MQTKSENENDFHSRRGPKRGGRENKPRASATLSGT